MNLKSVPVDGRRRRPSASATTRGRSWATPTRRCRSTSRRGATASMSTRPATPASTSATSMPSRDTPLARRPATAEKAATSTEELYRPREPGAKFVGVDIPAAHGVDVYIFAGPDMRQAVQRYNLFSGGGCLPPMWGLGVWYRASTELGQKEVLSFPARVPRAAYSVRCLRAGAWLALARLFVFLRLEPAVSRSRRLLRETQRAGLQAEPVGTRLHPPELAALSAASSVVRRLQGVGRPGARLRHVRGPENVRRLPRQNAGR